MDIQTIQGEPASRLGLAGQQPMETDCVDLAWQAGVNFFFSYEMGQSPLLTDLRSLLSQHRESVIIATGSEQREVSHWVDYVEQVQWTLDLDTIDILFVEYVSPADNWELVTGLLDQLYAWKAEGLIRYVGITTHTRSIALRVVEEVLCDVLMHRYNMAHRNAEEAVFPAIETTGLLYQHSLGNAFAGPFRVVWRTPDCCRLLPLWAVSTGHPTDANSPKNP